MMLACWQADPMSRPSMKKLEYDLEIFGSDEMKSGYARYRFTLSAKSFNIRCHIIKSEMTNL